MASFVRVALLTLLVFFAATSSRAVVIYDIKLYNGSGRSVELIDKATGRSWATIPPGRTKSFAYHGGVSLRCSGQQLTYTRVDPPPEYISAGLFSISFKAQLGSDLKIYLLPPSVSAPAAHLPAQPKGFPLRAATQRSNQAMQRTVGRAALKLSMTSTFNRQPNTPSPAVADLGSR